MQRERLVIPMLPSPLEVPICCGGGVCLTPTAMVGLHTRHLSLLGGRMLAHTPTWLGVPDEEGAQASCLLEALWMLLRGGRAAF